MSLSSKKHDRVLKIVGVILLASAVITAIFLVSLSFVKHVREEIVASKANECPKVYENDLFQFEYPCNSAVLPTGEGRNVKILEYTHSGTRERYLLIRTPSEDDQFAVVGDRFEECAGDERVSRWRITIPSVDGTLHDACIQGEHGGTTLTIRFDRSESGYISIAETDGSLDDIISSLKVK